MNTLRAQLFIALTLVALDSICGVARAGPGMGSAFPLAKGTYWVYQGSLTWTPQGSNEVREETVTWKMEVLETFSHGWVTAALVKGHPDDLWSYKEGRKPGEYLIIEVASDKFYLLEGERCKKALEHLRDAKDLLQGLVKESDLFLELPLKVGKPFGETEMLTRQDLFYRWWIEEKLETDLTDVKGSPFSGKVASYRITYRALSDHTSIEFVSGLGIIRYTGAHHGTASAIDVKLVEFHPGTDEIGY